MGRAYHVIARTVQGKRYAELCGRYENGSAKWRWVSHRGTLTRFEYHEAFDICSTEKTSGARVKIEAARQL